MHAYGEPQGDASSREDVLLDAWRKAETEARRARLPAAARPAAPCLHIKHYILRTLCICPRSRYVCSDARQVGASVRVYIHTYRNGS